MIRALAALLLWASPAFAGPGASTETPKAHWEKRASSLLYFDKTGALSDEVGLGFSEGPESGSHKVVETRGGTSPDGRYAWEWRRRELWNSAKIRRISATRTLRFLGTAGKALWKIDGADTPEKGDPLTFSGDGEVLIAAVKREKGFHCLVRNPLGGTFAEAGPFPKLVSMTLTERGSYAVIRWTDPDKSATFTILEVNTLRRKDIPSSKFLLGRALVTEEGKVLSGKRLIFDFSATTTDD